MITSGGKNLAPAALESALESASPLIAYLREPWLPGGDEVTTTLKLRRSHIAAKYAEEIEALYT
jgi:long-subunit acyl-CoA synthetase (AMP-forming)